MPARSYILFSLFSALALMFLSPVQAITSFVKYPANPIFIPGSLGGWDYRYVNDPFVLKQDGLYKMWYVGFGDIGRWTIGYAISPNGINSWSRLNYPVVDIGSIDGWEFEIADPTVLYFSDPPYYRMWYVSSRGGPPAGGDKSRLRYATSYDGIVWNELDWVLRSTPGTWDSGGIGRGRSIILRDGVYHMWYAATNNDDISVNPKFQIGYATSPDGIHWTKQNGGNPVITPSEPWELTNVSFPTVLYDEGIYKMWYAVGIGDQPTQIVYAYSTDGINWIKPADENPVIMRTSSTFDSTALTVSGILKESDHYRLYYSGYNGTNWSIGLATSTSIPTPAVPTNKVVIIPGMGVSWNADALLNCKRDDYSGDWTLSSWAENTYAPLLDSFTGTGLSAIPYYYDWRKQVMSHASNLTTFIDDLTAPTERVHLIGHSMGGLVGRAYLENQKENHQLDKFLTAGTPHKGTAFAYPSWSGGEIWIGNLWQRIALTFAVKRCDPFGNDRVTLQSHIPSVQNLLPITNYLRDQSTGAPKPVTLMDAKNNWLLSSSLGPPFFGATVGTLAGTGERTLETITVRDRTRRDETLGNWVDGKPVGRNEDGDGDGLVLPSSAQLTEANNRVLSQTHSGLVSSTEGITQIHDFLEIAGSSIITTAATQEPTSALVMVANPAIFWVESPTGQTKKDKAGTVTFYNPQAGNYRLRLIPTSSETLFIVGQFLPNGKTLWKEYALKNILPKFGMIHFDSTNPSEDIFR